MPISNFVHRLARPKVNTITRIDGQRALNVRADVLPGVLADDKIKEVRAWIATADIDPRVTVEFKGQDEDQAKARGLPEKAFVIALFLMFVILITQFNSFYSSFVILFAVVMSTIGVLIGLMITGQPFGIVMSGIGVIALAGIVVNHNIILVGTADRMGGSADSRREAILRTCAQRLRPVLLTTVTAILGLLPMVFRVNIDFITRGDHRRRALDPVVDAALHRHRLRAALCDGADSGADALRSDGARQHCHAAAEAPGEGPVKPRRRPS